MEYDKEILIQLISSIIHEREQNFNVILKNKPDLIGLSLFYTIIFGKDDWAISLLGFLSEDQIQSFTSLGLNLSISEALKINNCQIIKDKLQLNEAALSATKDESEKVAFIPTLEQYKFMPKDSLEQINVLDVTMDELLYEEHVAIHQLVMPCCLKNIKFGENLRNLTVNNCERRCDNAKGCERAQLSLDFLKCLSHQEDFKEGQFLFVGSVPKGTKVDRFNECDVQIRFKEDPYEMTENRCGFMDKLLTFSDERGDNCKAYLTKSGGCIIETKEDQINSYDFVPMIYAGKVNLCREMRNQLQRLKNCQLDGWKEMYRKAICNSVLFFENPEFANTECEAYKVIKFSNLDGVCFKIELFIPDKLMWEEIDDEKRKVITSVKILAQKLGLRAVKSYTIEIITLLITLTGKISRDMYNVVQFPTLKRHFKKRINYAQWDLLLKEADDDENFGDKFKIPLLSNTN